jgi:hypothetical protein
MADMQATTTTTTRTGDFLIQLVAKPRWTRWVDLPSPPIVQRTTLVVNGAEKPLGVMLRCTGAAAAAAAADAVADASWIIDLLICRLIYCFRVRAPVVLSSRFLDR